MNPVHWYPSGGFRSGPRPGNAPSRLAGLAGCILMVLLGALSVSVAAARENPEEQAGFANAPPAPEFSFADVEGFASQLAGRAYENPDGRVPEFLLGLTAEAWDTIDFNDDHTLWREDGLPFDVRFFHPGFIYNRTVSLNVVEGGISAPIAFNPDWFKYNDPGLEQKVREVPLNFAGFRVHFPINAPEIKDEVAVFLGATYFRAVGKNTGYGLAARGLAVNTALPDGEEFPYFREFWLVKPSPEATAMTIYALMDSPSMTGAFHFIIRPGTSTVMDVNSSFFPRAGASRPEKIGLTPLSSMYLYSEKENGSRNDYRPEVHNSDALLFTNGQDWFRRPLANPGRLAITRFDLKTPHGFGLIQQDATFDHYQDIAARFEHRPSLWVEPRGAWGSGKLELIEIPAHEDYHDNILVFWIPDPPGAPLEAPPAGAAPVSVAYRLYWMAPNVVPHQMGRAVATRLVPLPEAEAVRVIVDFESEDLNALPADTGMTSLVETPAENPVLSKQLVKNPATGGWRLQFTMRVQAQSGMMSSILRDAPQRPRIRAMLKKGENLPDPLTEIWVYDLPQ